MASPFTSAITRTLPFPSDASASVTIRKLAPRHLDAAQKEQQRKAIAAFKEMGGTAALKEFREVDSNLVDAAEQKALVVADEPDPMAGYDKVTLIAKGVVSWTYDGKDPKDEETVEDLDEETRDWLAEQILRLARPRLFQSADEVEAEEKNDLRLSTVA